MGIGIYKAADPTALFSSGTNENPLLIACDGVLGTVLSRKFYVRNDDSLNNCTNITLQPVVTSGANIIDGTNGFGWKLIAGNTQPLEEQWDLVSYANSIVIPDLVSIATYEPFWLRVVAPQGAPVQSYSGVVLRLTFDLA